MEKKGTDKELERLRIEHTLVCDFLHLSQNNISVVLFASSSPYSDPIPKNSGITLFPREIRHPLQQKADAIEEAGDEDGVSPEPAAGLLSSNEILLSFILFCLSIFFLV
jgi:hypothetical protein